MAEVLEQFPDPLHTRDGSTYVAQACGAPNQRGLWEGWIEFLPVSRGQPLRSPRETTQPNRIDAEYWATGLTMVYLEGALQRALNPPTRRVLTRPRAMFGASSHCVAVTTVPNARQDAILDPFAIYKRGEKLLRQELSALAAWHLVNIARAYGLRGESAAPLNARPAAQLVELIVRGVRSRSGQRTHSA
jgi:hypothetical protein